ncbi:hypothetical protein [Nocardia sp. NPDC057668]|uniref:hypothetical protein n=1 Tax=Nocardia sp. NPDC057668 TaxID=3346202 RepID=UPI0036722131
MTSDITPEFAIRGKGEQLWCLSWLPEATLTREQARAGMELDEILSDPEVVFDDSAHCAAADRAAALGILVEHAVIMLAQRMAERAQRRATPARPQDTETVEAVMAGWYSTPAPRTPAATGARSQHLWA